MRDPYPRLPRPAFALLLSACMVPLLAAQTSAPVPVRAQAASELLLPSSASAAALVLSPNDAVLAAEVGAPVARIAADVGARVQRGELLLELDCTDLKLALAQAEAQVGAARARAELAAARAQRGETLGQKSFISADELLAMRTERRAAEAEVKVIEAQRAVAARQVDKCRISAPFDAVVMERQAQVGALAAPGTPLLRVVDVSASEVEARLPEADAIGLGQARGLAFESQQRRYPVRLLRISEVVEPSTRSRIARFAFVDNAAPAGASGTLHWQAAGGRLPAALLVQRDGELGVFVVDQGIARFVAVPGAQAGRPADVPRAPGALIVTEGQQGLHDGLAVTLQAD
jgi:RND family efflux transporter MFP subunit